MSPISARFTAADSALRTLPQRRPVKFALATVLACALAAAAAAQSRAVDQPQTEGDATLTNAAVIKLVRAKFSDKMIVAIIRSRPARFDLSPDRLIELKKGGASERVILAMLSRGDEGQFAGAQGGGDPEDDAFFEGLGGSPRKLNAGAQPNQSDPNSVDIFGSSGGVRGQTQTNGVNGGVSGETQTTGSATVRIIRPQEQNGAAAKLERTPTLTNQSVIDLVEAGFSEGTIVRRIENSPAEFDLSPAKLADLRKRRVSEPVINAMRAAMGDDAPAAPARPNDNR
ncbi:MAG TPA: hypothetical protein VM864_14605 [Pyrinomonadaceae bacterium]|nr:hypothetical protein [Pyrinomonadaceae bacterium]